ncbi:hypothetical protein [Loktanella salsilacus]|uniref:hypothetical protein n=1 Tax=Loktanella salsilacus TaxID=195913 RepID=UPI003734EC6C
MIYDYHNIIRFQGDEDHLTEMEEVVGTPDHPLSFAKIIPFLTTSEDEHLSLPACKYNGMTKNNTHIFVGRNRNGIIQFQRELKSSDFTEAMSFRPNCMMCWCTENWGCNSEPDEISICRTEGKITYDFFSSSPPYGIINRLREIFPELHISAYFHSMQDERAGYY